jgi:hypothetical protein
MSQSFPSNFGLNHLNAALLADDTTMLHPLVSATETLIVFNGSKDLGTEKTVPLGLESPIVNSFRFLDLSIAVGSGRPRQDLLR